MYKKKLKEENNKVYVNPLVLDILALIINV